MEVIANDRGGSATVLRIIGEVDVGNERLIREAIQGVLDRGRNLSRKKNKSMKLVNLNDEVVWRPFMLSGIANLFDICDSLEDAIREVEREGP